LNVLLGVGFLERTGKNNLGEVRGRIWKER